MSNIKESWHFELPVPLWLSEVKLMISSQEIGRKSNEHNTIFTPKLTSWCWVFIWIFSSTSKKEAALSFLWNDTLQMSNHLRIYEKCSVHLLWSCLVNSIIQSLNMTDSELTKNIFIIICAMCTYFYFSHHSNLHNHRLHQFKTYILYIYMLIYIEL